MANKKVEIPIWFMTLIVAASFTLNMDLWKRMRSVELDVARITTALEITTQHDVCLKIDAKTAKVAAIAGNQLNQAFQKPQNSSTNNVKKIIK